MDINKFEDYILSFKRGKRSGGFWKVSGKITMYMEDVDDQERAFILGVELSREELLTLKEWLEVMCE